MKTLVSLALLVMLLGCGSEPVSKWNVEECQDGTCRTSEDDPRVEPQGECQGAEPFCAAICGDAWAVCRGGEWDCEYSGDVCDNPEEPEPEPETCQTTSESTLDGVRIEFLGDGCFWSVDEAQAGIKLPYRIIVESEVDVTPDVFTSCPRLGAAGLAHHEEITGNAQHYCICDEGLCPLDIGSTRLVPGVHELAIEWEGRNWRGPSDTGNPLGEPFPPGIYEAVVKATGVDDASGEPYELRASLLIHLF